MQVEGVLFMKTDFFPFFSNEAYKNLHQYGFWVSMAFLSSLFFPPFPFFHLFLGVDSFLNFIACRRGIMHLF